jgi:hypothetical protein
MADDGSAAMALARSISNAIDAEIQRNWVKVGSNRKAASSALLSFSPDLFEDAPIDGLDVLGIEPHLIVRTILQCEVDVDEILMPTELLDRMLQDFDKLDDEVLSAFCSAKDSAHPATAP